MRKLRTQRDNQQWMLDLALNMRGRVQNFERDDLEVPAGKLLAVPLTIDGDEVTYSVLGGDAFGGFREFSDPATFRLQLLGYSPGVGYVVVSTTKGGKLQPHFILVVKVTGPAPGPTPVPPGPGPEGEPAGSPPLSRETSATSPPAAAGCGSAINASE